jgi:hypothetical protein
MGCTLHTVIHAAQFYETVKAKVFTNGVQILAFGLMLWMLNARLRQELFSSPCRKYRCAVELGGLGCGVPCARELGPSCIPEPHNPSSGTSQTHPQA